MQRFEIIKQAGQGGYGRIDRARDTILERDVAIKTLDPLFKIELGEDDIERFRREAQTLARLTHPNIPAIYDITLDVKAKEFRIVFEWVEGETARHRLTKSGVMSLEEVRILMTAVCSALAHAHSFGIVHRDVKPPNIIITPGFESCYLVDFGIALRDTDIERLTSASGIGTPVT